MIRTIALLATLSFAGATLACDCCAPAGKTGATSPAVAGIQGEALRYPLQGIVPVDPYKPKPQPVVNVEFVAKDAKTGKVVARTKSDKDGKYKLVLPPGTYTLEAKSGDWVYNEKVTVGTNQFVKLRSFFKYTGNVFPPSAPRK